MMFVDRLFLANYSPDQGEAYISASLIGSLTSFMIFGIFMMTAAYSNALVSQFVGAGKKGYAHIITMQTFYLALFIYPIMILISFFIYDFYALFNHSELQTTLESQYTSVMLWGSILIIIRSGVSGFFIGIGKSQVVMISNLVGMLVNIPLNYSLIYGVGFIPEMGILGASLATLIAVSISVLILMIVYFNKNYREKYGTSYNFSFHYKSFTKLFIYGFPSGIEFFFGIGAFNYFVLVMSSYGPVIGAAVTIAINWDTIFFIPMLGINSATMAMVGRHMGARNIIGAQNIAFLSLFVSVAYAILIGIILLIIPSYLVNMFLEDMANPDEVFVMAVTLIHLITLYIVADAIHISLEGALKGAGDTQAVMTIFIIIAIVFAIIIHFTAGTQLVSPMIAWYIFIGYAVSLGIGMGIRYLQGVWKKIDMVNS